MKNPKQKEVCEEILKIRERIFEKQKKYEELCGMEPSVEFEKNIFEILLNIHKKLSTFSFVNSFADKEFSFIRPKLKTKNIIKKLEKVIDMLKKEYYYELSETVGIYIRNEIMKNKFMESEVDKLTEFKDSIIRMKFISNHSEVDKVSELLFYAQSLNDVYRLNGSEKIYILEGIKAVLNNYSEALDKLDEVSDNSLKRAVLSYISDVMQFSFFDNIK